MYKYNPKTVTGQVKKTYGIFQFVMTVSAVADEWRNSISFAYKFNIWDHPAGESKHLWYFFLFQTQLPTTAESNMEVTQGCVVIITCMCEWASLWPWFQKEWRIKVMNDKYVDECINTESTVHLTEAQSKRPTVVGNRNCPYCDKSLLLSLYEILYACGLPNNHVSITVRIHAGLCARKQLWKQPSWFHLRTATQ